MALAAPPAPAGETAGRVAIRRRELAALALLILLAAGLSLHFGLKVAFFQNDEQQYMELARYVAAHFPDALWQGGIYPRGPQRLDPWLLAIPFGFARGPGAFEAGHVIQALLFASTALPVFLLARRADLGALASLFAACLSAVVPWAIVSTSFLAESAAYPAFAWVLFATWAVMEAPSLRREALLVLAVLVAVLARTAMLALIPLAPLAVLWQEWRLGLAGSPLRARPRLLAARMWARYRIVSVAIVLGALTLVLALAGALPGRGLAFAAGGYGLPQIEPLSGLLVRYRDYGSRLAVGTGFLALTVGLPWLVLALVRPVRERAHALAVVCLLSILAVMATLLNTGPDERYIVYAAVPVSLMAAAGLVEVRRSRRRSVAEAALALAATGGVIALILATTWPPASSAYDYFAYPSAIFYQRAILERFGHGAVPLLHSSPGTAAAIVLALVALAWAAARVSGVMARWAAGALGAAILGVCLLQLVYNEKKFTDQVGALGPYADQRSWVDEHVPSGAQVGALALSMGGLPGYVAIWRDAEFWNASITKDVYFTAPGTLPLPMGSEQMRLSIDPASGALTAMGGEDLLHSKPVPRYLVVPRQGTNVVGAEGTVVAVSSYAPLELVRLVGTPRLRWTMAGTTPEGFVAPGQAAVATVFPAALPGGTRSCASFSLITLPGYTGRIPFRITSGPHVVRTGGIAAGETIAVKEPLYPSPGTAGPEATISALMLPGGREPTGVPPEVKLAFFEVAPCG